jgi:hypothetical protein
MFCNSVCHLVREDTANTNARGDLDAARNAGGTYRRARWWYGSSCSLPLGTK